LAVTLTVTSGSAAATTDGRRRRLAKALRIAPTARRLAFPSSLR
jgi:hypothetical protein